MNLVADAMSRVCLGLNADDCTCKCGGFPPMGVSIQSSASRSGPPEYYFDIRRRTLEVFARSRGIFGYLGFAPDVESSTVRLARGGVKRPI